MFSENKIEMIHVLIKTIYIKLKDINISLLYYIITHCSLLDLINDDLPL